MPRKIAGPAASVVPSKCRISESRRRRASMPEVRPRLSEEVLGGGSKTRENARPAMLASLQAQLRATRLRRLRVALWPRAAVWQLSVSLLFHPIHSSYGDIHTHFQRCGQNVSCKEVVTFDCTLGERSGKFHFSYWTNPDTVTSGLTSNSTLMPPSLSVPPCGR